MIEYLLTLQVSLSASYRIQDKLLTFHAHLWLHLWDDGQVFSCLIWKISYKTWGVPSCGSFDTFSNTTIHIPFTIRICLLSVQTLHIQMVHVFHVACDHIFFYNVFRYIHSWEESIQQTQCPSVGRTKIQETSKHHHNYISLLMNSKSLYFTPHSIA